LPSQDKDSQSGSDDSFLNFVPKTHYGLENLGEDAFVANALMKGMQEAENEKKEALRNRPAVNERQSPQRGAGPRNTSPFATNRGTGSVNNRAAGSANNRAPAHDAGNDAADGDDVSAHTLSPSNG